MMKTRSRSLAAIAAGALLLAPLAGCGSSDDKKADSTSGASASSSPSAPDDPSAGSSASTSAEGSVAPQEFLAKVVKAMREKKTAHMVISIGSSMTADADVAYTNGDKTAMRMTMTAGNQNVQVILLDGVMYLQQAAGGKFVKIDKNDPAMGTLLDQFATLGPEASLDAMKTGLTKVAKVGTEKIDGKSFDEYALTVDTKAIAGSLGTLANKADLPATVTYTMYVDGDDLLRRVNMEVGDQKVVMNVTDWGKSIKIEAPDASKIQSR
ncbi:LppX_LprAFG lipoprotein [Marmoricola sp. RAF53]|uniref:LppX_LprAFG lipoprotein n=1 Tax=Marmoricola sp. RAF53 TaxID=3233059 RepID=UPI003F96EE00